MISYIMPVFGSDRIENARAVLQTWEGKGEMIIACPPGEPLVTHPDARIVQAAIPAGVWEKAVLLNAGAHAAKGELLVFLDCDIPLPEGWHDRAEEWPHECFTGYTDFWRLTEGQSRAARAMIEAGERDIPMRSSEYYAHGGCGAGGIFCITPSLFARVGPWTALPCWGYEDVDYANRCRATLGYLPGERAMPGSVVHLWHPICDKRDSERNREMIHA